MKYLIFLICVSLPAYLVRFDIGGIPTTLLELIIYAVFIYGLFNLRRSSKIKIDKKILFPIGLLLLAIIVSTYISPLKLVALGQAKAYFIDPLLVFYLIISFIKKEDFIWIYAGLITSATYVSLYSIWQKIIGDITTDNRVVGIFGYSPNYVALFLAPIITLLAILNYKFIILNKFSNQKFQLQKNNIFTKILLLLSLIICLYALMLTGSRGGELAVFGGILFYFICINLPRISKNVYIKLSFILLFIILIFAIYSIFGANFSIGSGRTASSSNVRMQIWQTSIEMIKQQPILGVGLGNFQNAFGELTKNRPNFPEYITPEALTPHNVFLMYYLTTGLVGLIAFIWILFIFFREGFKYQHLHSNILMAIMVAILFHGLVDAAYFSNALSIIFWAVIAMIMIQNEE